MYISCVCLHPRQLHGTSTSHPVHPLALPPPLTNGCAASKHLFKHIDTIKLQEFTKYNTAISVIPLSQTLPVFAESSQWWQELSPSSFLSQNVLQNAPIHVLIQCKRYSSYQRFLGNTHLKTRAQHALVKIKVPRAMALPWCLRALGKEDLKLLSTVGWQAGQWNRWSVGLTSVLMFIMVLPKPISANAHVML